ncbi:hypothetical protein [Microbacterium sp. NPDC055665]
MSNGQAGKQTAHQRRGKTSAQRGAGEVSQDEVNSVLEALRRLVEAASDSGRDWKLIDALLQTMIELVLETEGDVLVPAEPQDYEPIKGADAKPSSGGSNAQLPRRLRPEYRLRIEAVVDSWSDDETADFLMIGLRQVQRRARRGTLYYFLVNRKRRFPVWQFDRSCGVLAGVAQVGQALPPSWPVEQVYGFMTTQNPSLKLVTPTQWLLMRRDPESILTAIADAQMHSA